MHRHSNMHWLYKVDENDKPDTQMETYITVNVGKQISLNVVRRSMNAICKRFANKHNA